MSRLSTVPSIRRAAGPAIALAAALGLAACGQGAETTGDAASDSARPETPKPQLPTEAEKVAMLASLPAPYNEGDLENGRRAFARCRSCHTITPSGPNMTGPNLYGVFGSAAGAREKYSYSHAMRTAGFTWDAETLDHWLQNPRSFLPGNKMSFAGLPDATDRRDIIAFLKVETGFKPQGG
ncbi:c-type cytochrome [Brevundimonas diminuta]|uniref:c-type cytochrome n=1 Tax=Brevundimonas diminuta TaxID=293 RepID=UPI003CFCFB99